MSDNINNVNIKEKKPEKKFYTCDTLPVGKFGKVINFAGQDINFVVVVIKTEDERCIIISSTNNAFPIGAILRNGLYNIVLSNINGIELEEKVSGFVPFNISFDVNTFDEAKELFARINASYTYMFEQSKNIFKDTSINNNGVLFSKLFDKVTEQILKNTPEEFKNPQSSPYMRYIIHRDCES